MDSTATLITGGYGAKQSAEVFLPSLNTTCELPSLPQERWGHVQSGNTLCGGRSSSTWRSCLEWSAGWIPHPVTLTEGRRGSSVWGSEEGLVIMGGEAAARHTSERVSSDGANTTVASFRMECPIR